MKAGFVRTSIDVPDDLHRRLHEAAARKGCSARQLILKSLEQAVEDSAQTKRKRRLRLERPIVASRDKRFDLSNEQIYEILGRS